MKNRVLHIVYRAAAGLVSFVFGAAVADAEPFVSVDYGSRTGKLNKYLHCSSWAPRR